MSINFRLEKSKVCLLIIDVQDKLFPKVERPCETMHSLHKLTKGFQILNLPIIVTEQYPEGLGNTVLGLKNLLGETATYFTKTTFSCFADNKIADKLKEFDQFVVAGIETHVCVLQTIKDLLKAKKEVVMLNDATSSRSIYDFSTGIAESLNAGARISSVETVLFELLHDAKAPEFKQMSNLIK